MISDATIAGLEERKLEYILGVGESNTKEVYVTVGFAITAVATSSDTFRTSPANVRCIR